MLKVEDVEIRLAGGDRESADQAPLFKLASLQVKAGEVAVLMGPSGSGKSTFLKWLLGESLPDFEVSGRLFLNDDAIEDKPVEARRIGMLWQDVLLLPHLTVAENLAFALPPRLRRASVGERHAAVDNMLLKIQLREYADVYPNTLSGGQQARVGLARAMINEPAAILLDEPFSALDLTLRASIRDWTYRQLREWNIPAIVVSHDPADADPQHQVQVVHV